MDNCKLIKQKPSSRKRIAEHVPAERLLTVPLNINWETMKNWDSKYISTGSPPPYTLEP